MRAQYKINFDRPPRLKKLPEALIFSPKLRHLYIHTYKQTDTEDTNRNLDRLYITRPKRLDTSKRRHAILRIVCCLRQQIYNVAMFYGFFLTKVKEVARLVLVESA
jgi:hypothetical protein